MKLNSTKIAIPVETPSIYRPRLLNALRENLNNGNATVVNGRAGTGKTLLATDFARRCNRPVAWYKVDAPDAKLSIFIEYLVASVAQAFPGFGAKTQKQFPENAVEFSLSKLVESFIYELENQMEPLLLVLDDLHLIYDAEWLSPFFQRLLTLLPAEVHILIIGRGLPPAPLWRMRSKHRLFVLNEQMLFFNTLEAEELFSAYGLSSKQAHLTLELTGGRASNLRAAAIQAKADTIMDFG
ncbi:MAG: AAA family ATPase [Acidobacteria bacterium]|nr:AAA family ATPase [Acidobacteriota bacterium]